jgi:protein-disulfide isomerase-like protein with CxxC motif
VQQAVADFWWLHVMPARLALQRRAFKEGRALTQEEQVQEAAPFQPLRRHAFSEALRERSKQMLKEANQQSLQTWDAQATAAAVQSSAAGLAQSTVEPQGIVQPRPKRILGGA